MSRKILVVGAGGHARSVIDVIEADATLTIAGVVDPVSPDTGFCLGYPWLGSDDRLGSLVAQYRNAVIGMGQLPKADVRIRLFSRLCELGADFPLIVSPRAVVSPHASIGRGTVVMHGAVINAGAVVGENCIINSMALIEHDVEVGDHCHVSTGALVNGECVVGRESFIGSGTVVFHQVVLPPRSVVGAGSVVRPAHPPLRSAGKPT